MIILDVSAPPPASNPTRRSWHLGGGARTTLCHTDVPIGQSGCNAELGNQRQSLTANNNIIIITFITIASSLRVHSGRRTHGLLYHCGGHNCTGHSDLEKGSR